MRMERVPAETLQREIARVLPFKDPEAVSDNIFIDEDWLRATLGVELMPWQKEFLNEQLGYTVRVGKYSLPQQGRAYHDRIMKEWERANPTLPDNAIIPRTVLAEYADEYEHLTMDGTALMGSFVFIGREDKPVEVGDKLSIFASNPPLSRAALQAAIRHRAPVFTVGGRGYGKAMSVRNAAATRKVVADLDNNEG